MSEALQQAAAPESIEDVPVRIIGDHPHAGEQGVIRFTNGTTPVHDPLGMGWKMYEVHFPDGGCAHGTRSAFAEKKNLTVLPQEPPKPRPRRRRVSW